jgi:hypothetical protein
MVGGRVILVAAMCTIGAVGCLIDFDGYRTGPGATEGQGGSDNDASAGSGGSGGGMSGNGGSTGIGGSNEGGQTGAGGGQSGAGGSATGGSGGASTGGTGGSGGTCGFNFCAVNTNAPPQGCSPCQQAVCNGSGLTTCCNNAWDFLCVVEAAALPECSCGQTKCSSAFATPTTGTCVTSGTCNPVAVTGCSGGSQCVVDADYQQESYKCQTIGDRTMCQTCNPSASSNCATALSCIVGRCARMCCTATDCPIGMSCRKDVLIGEVGVCIGAN